MVSLAGLIGLMRNSKARGFVVSGGSALDSGFRASSLAFPMGGHTIVHGFSRRWLIHPA